MKPENREDNLIPLDPESKGAYLKTAKDRIDELRWQVEDQFKTAFAQSKTEFGWSPDDYIMMWSIEQELLLATTALYYASQGKIPPLLLNYLDML